MLCVSRAPASATHTPLARCWPRLQGHYLRHRNYEAWLDRYDGSELFAKVRPPMLAVVL
jgi:hypothetical protein